MKTILGAGRRADAQPIQLQSVAAGNPVLRVEGHKISQDLLLAAIGHIALIFGDDEGEACDLGRKIAQFDTTKVAQRDHRKCRG